MTLLYELWGPKRKLKTFFALIFVVFTMYSLSGQEGTLFPPPGIYNDSVFLEPQGNNLEITGKFVPGNYYPFDFTQPIELSALPGEERRYQIALEALDKGVLRPLGTVEYVIDRKPPQIAPLAPGPGLYTDPLVVGVSTADISDTLRVWVNGQPQNFSEIKLPGRPGQLIRYAVRVEAEDRSGNQSSPVQGIYTIDRRQETGALSLLELLSPVEGSFLNPQIVYLRATGLEKIFYSLDGSDPLENGLPYQGPFEISGVAVQLRVAGVDTAGTIYSDSVTFSAGNSTYPGVSQGFLNQQVDLPPLSDRTTYTTLERTPGAFDPNFDRPLRISPQLNTLRAFTLRIGRQSGDRGEFRLFFLLEGRSPGAPDPTFMSGAQNTLLEYKTIQNRLFSSDILLPLGGNLGYQFSTTDGSTLFVDEPLSLGEIAVGLGLPSLTGSGDTQRILIQQKNQGGNLGPERQLSFSWPESLGVTEGFELIQEGETIEIRAPSPGVYYSFGTNPDSRLVGVGRLSVPRGLKREGTLRFWEVLEDGTPGKPIDSLPFVLDAQLPPGPEINLEGRRVTIESSYPVQYRVLSSTSEAPGILTDFAPYLGPFELRPLPGGNVSYRVEAFAQVSPTEQSSTSRTRDVYLNEVSAPIPELMGLLEGGFLKTEILSTAIANYDPGFEYSYRIEVDGEELTVGSIEDNQLVLTVPAIEARATVYLSARSKDTSGTLADTENEISFSIDRIPPGPPRILSPTEDTISNTLVSIVLEKPENEDGVVLYQIDPTDPQEYVYSGPIRVDGSQNETTQYFLRAVTEDRAGNRSEEVTRRIVIDKTPPDTPNIRIRNLDGQEIELPGQGVLSVREDLEILLESPYPVYIELNSQGGNPGIPGLGSPLYSGPIVVSADPGQIQTLRFLARAKDDVGNFSPLHRIVEIQVRKVVPDAPVAPTISRDGNTGLLEWPGGTTDIRFRIKDQGDFRGYQGPVTWSIPSGSNELAFEYFLVDSAGNESVRALVSIPRRNQTGRPLVQGPNTAGPFATLPDFQVEPTKPQAEIRFELSLSGEPREVNPLSPLWNPEVLTEPVTGETLDYRFVFRQFEEGFEASDPVTLEFTVDKTPPLPPEADLEFQSVHYSPVSFTFLLEDGTALYRVEEEEIEGLEPPELLSNEPGIDITNSESYELAPEVLQFSGSPGKAIRYLIYGISRDDAGNVSEKARIWEIIVDRQGIYVHPEGSARANGTRVSPVASLSQALDILNRGERNKIFLVQGSYSLDRTLEIRNDVELVGGFSPTWQQEGLETLLVPSTRFEGTNLVDVGPDGSLGIHGLYVTDPNTLVQVLLQARGGRIFSEQGLLLASPGGLVLLSADNGAQVSFENSVFLSYEGSAEKLFQVSNNSSLGIKNSEIQFPETPAFLVSSQAIPRVYTTIRVLNSSLFLENTDIQAPRARVATNIYLVDSSAEIVSSTIQVPRALELGLGIHGIRSSLDLIDTDLQGNRVAATGVLVRVDGGGLNVRGGEFALDGNLSALGIIGQDSEISFTDSEILGGSAEDFMTVFQLSRSRVTVNSNQIQSPWKTRELVFASLESVTGVWSNNSLDLSNTGPVLGFHIISSGANEIEGNQLTGTREGTAVYIADSSSIVNVQDNIFSTWQTLLVRNLPGSETQFMGSSVFTDIRSLEATREDGQIFIGNRVDQGL